MAPGSGLNLQRAERLPGTADDLLDRRLGYAASVGALLLFLPLLIPLVNGQIFALDDLSSFHLPLRYLYQRALTNGYSLLWTSDMFSGFYVHAEGQIGAFHPLHLILYATLPLTIAFNLELILSYVFAFWGMWCFLRYVGFATASSIVGAVGFAFSGFALLHLPHMNAIAVVAHVPWLLLGIDLAISESPASRAKGLVSVALLFASQGLLGYPQYVWISALACLLYGLLCGRMQILRLVLAGAASAAGLMVAGIQLLPTFDLLSASLRTTVGTDFALSYSLHPLNVVQLFSPYLLVHRVYAAPHERLIHEFGVYSGSLATVAIFWAIIRRGRLPFGRLAVFAGAACLLGLVLALGRYGGLYQWVTLVPLVGKFRAPSRHLVLLHLGLSFLVAILFEDLRRLVVTRPASPQPLGWLSLPVLVSGCAAAVGTLYPQLWQTFPHQPVFGTGMLIGVLCVALAGTLVRDGARGSRAALIVLPCAFALDLGLWGYSYVFAEGMITTTELARRAAPPAAEAGSTVHRAARSFELNALLLHDLRVLRPYVGLIPSRSLALSTDAELRVSGVQWLSTAAGWTRVNDPMPRVRFVPHWKLTDNPAALSDIDVRQTALVAEDLTSAAEEINLVDATASLVVDQPGRMTVDVSTRAPALLVTTEAFDHGWRATGSSGSTLRTLPVYGDYLGILVQPGDYRLAVAFKPDSLRRGLYASLSGLVLTLVLATAVARTRSRQ
jgi:hypothetical protein